MNRNIFNLFFETGHLKVIRVLLYSSGPVSLREFSYRSNISLSSVQNSLKILLKKGFVIQKKKKNRKLFTLNITPNEQNFLKSFFRQLTQFDIQSKSESYRLKAQNVLEQLSHNQQFISEVKIRAV